MSISFLTAWSAFVAPKRADTAAVAPRQPSADATAFRPARAVPADHRSAPAVQVRLSAAARAYLDGGAPPIRHQGAQARAADFEPIRFSAARQEEASPAAPAESAGQRPDAPPRPPGSRLDIKL
jgi:hypothetical protein